MFEAGKKEHVSEDFEMGLLDVLSTHYGKIDGITQPTLFAGAFGTWFPLHFEDMDIYAANLMLEGEPKVFTFFINKMFKNISVIEQSNLKF
jgi:hypothetical protein